MKSDLMHEIQKSPKPYLLIRVEGKLSDFSFLQGFIHLNNISLTIKFFRIKYIIWKNNYYIGIFQFEFRASFMFILVNYI